MGFIISRIGVIFISLIMFSACVADVDLTGFIRSTDRIEDRFQLSLAWNELNPPKTIVVSNENYNLLVAADLHVGDTTFYKQFLSQGTEPDISAMVFVGDFVTGKEKDYKNFYSLLPAYQVKPSFLLTGNHELYFDGWKHFYSMFGSSVYYFTVQTPTEADLFICLDSGSGTLGKSQLNWLKNLLNDHRDAYNQCVIFTHVNFFRNRPTASTNPLINELLVLMDLFEKHQVNLVVMGHDHIRAVNVLGNTTYLTLDALLDGIWNASYVSLTKESSGLKYEFIEMVFP